MPDAVAIIRGGGAVNDLAWLNDYDLARCICELDIPVLTGIGHERDSTVLDEVANLRFDTPSKVVGGIEGVIRQRVGEAKTLWDHLAKASARLVGAARHAIERDDAAVRAGVQRQVVTARQRGEQFMGAVRVGALHAVRSASDGARESLFVVREHASRQVTQVQTALPALDAEIRSGVRQTLRSAAEHTDRSWAQVAERAQLQARRTGEVVDQAMDSVAAGSGRWIADATSHSAALIREIAGQGPQKTLGRGFAIVRTSSGAAISSAANAPLGDPIEIGFHDGRVHARTEQPEEGNTQ